MSEQKLTCPKCGRGTLREGGIGFVCSYFKSTDDKCDFVVYREMFGHTITADDLAAICAGEKTERYTLKKQRGGEFSAAFAYDREKGAVAPAFGDKLLEGATCPKCGGKIKIGSRFISCENSSAEKKGHVFFGRTIAGVELEQEAVEALLRGEKTGVIAGFQGRTGEFAAALYLKDGGVEFDYNICSCPACGKGSIRMGKKTYYCTGCNATPKCSFHVWLEMGGKAITPELVQELCQNGETGIMKGFKTKDGKAVARKMVINEQRNVVLI